MTLEQEEDLRESKYAVSSYVSVAFLAAWAGWVPFCWAQSDGLAPDARAILKRGTIEAGGTVGYWEEFLFPTEAHTATRHAIFVMPRLGVVMTDETDAGLLSGNLQILVEPFYGRFQNRFSADTVGASLIVKYNLLSFGRWVPFWDAGVGVLWTDLAPRIAEDSSQVNFALQTGPGVQYFPTTRLAVTVGVRYHHISNAGIGQRNLGLDAVLPYAGMSWFFSH
ncbi:MAG: hypothetical protein A4E19_04535 [Nitrospira sp. SG-bin1]|nr:MAG: hypothetical protein A4E19_04535 [Nitrospira sp. SG-bin1]